MIYPFPLGQMQALHEVVQKGWVRYIGMSSCWAWQCMLPSFQPAHPLALIMLPFFITSPSDAE